MKLYLWYASTSGMTIQERTRSVMNPTPPKKEEEIASALESWVTETRLIEQQGPNYVLPPAFKMTALKIIMTIKEDQFEQMLRSPKVTQTTDGQDRVNALIEEIREYANRRRLEAKLRQSANMPTPMQLGQVGQEESGKDNEGNQENNDQR